MKNNLNHYIYIPSERFNNLETEALEKLSYLKKHTIVKSPMYVMPDIADDTFILSGIAIQTNEYFFPLSAGSDLGCGYRVLKSPLKKRELIHIEDKLELLATSITDSNQKEKSPYLLNCFLNKEIDNINSFLLFNNTLIPKIRLRNLESSSHRLSKQGYQNAWGTIAKGNHFLEIREISEIYNHQLAKYLNINNGDMIVHIHSGSGIEIEKEFIKYFGLFYKKAKKNSSIKDNRNGYQIVSNISDVLSIEYFDDVYDSMYFSMLNRSFLSLLMRQWFWGELYDLFDAFHDGFIVEGKNILSQKGIQTYQTEHELAIIPGTLNTPSYLVKKKKKHSFINHGTGESEKGHTQRLSTVKTNIKKNINRKYHDIEQIIKYCLENNLVELIAKLKPWICIKNE